MIKSLWINLPVNDVAKSKDFFTKIGFTPNNQYGSNEDSASFIVGENGIIIMLFKKVLYESFADMSVSDKLSGAEVLFSIDGESVEEVDELAKKIVEAGGSIYAAPGYKDGWMYGCGFIDLDGQRWNILYIDLSKMPLG